VHSVQKQFHKFFQAHDLMGKSFLVAVSGGVDSMVLAHLFLKSGISFKVAHCNFQLRGQASDEDEEFVGKWCTDNKITLFSKRFDLGEGSVQLNARNARYQWFDELQKESLHDFIATAHHLNDSLETLLLNLVRGTGLKGLTGIETYTPTIIRPLAEQSKEEILEYAKAVQIAWREDHTNSESYYDRNFIRNKVLPLLLELNPSLVQTFQNTLERLKLSQQFIEQKADEWPLKEEAGSIALDLSQLKQTDVVLLNELLNRFGFNYVTVKSIWASRRITGSRFESAEWEAFIDRESLHIRKKGAHEVLEMKLDEPGVHENDTLKVAIEKMVNVPADLYTADPFTAYFDFDQLDFPLKLRKWQLGDRIKPLGMTGYKKVSDLLIDEKVSMVAKEKVLVLESGGEIAWVVNHRVSEVFKIKKRTSAIAKVRVMFKN
jgi:tRNA(Ile)-lysidine synthase